MLKFLSITLLLAINFQGYNFAAVENVVLTQNTFSQLPLEISSKWEKHINDFFELVDVDKLVDVVFGYVTDPEVLNFATFIFSNEFKQMVKEFEAMAEFKEAFKYLADKGYELGAIIDYINTALDLPPFEKPKTNIILKAGKGMTGLIEDLIATLPIEDFKKLFETKLDTDPEVAELFETINSPEFMDIMKKMSKNPKFEEFKKTFERYGFDFKYLCKTAKDIFGKYYQGVFCG